MAAITVAATLHPARSPMRPWAPAPLPTTPASYLGVYVDGVPASYAGVTSFTGATGVRPNVVSYYSGWMEPFQKSFAVAATARGAVPLVQIDPTDISLHEIAARHYDGYLISYAKAVRAFRHPVILSFGHEMNGNWYSWGYTRASPAAFVAAWRHIVDVFRAAGARNVTWLWTVNTFRPAMNIQDPAAWWPGRSYVTWVGIDGYFHTPSAQFISVFGPTITVVRELTKAPILLAETGASQAAGQAAKITDVFAGIRAYQLLGFVWFDVVAGSNYGINKSRDAIEAFRRGATTFGRRVL
jgi:mannan endo-1,4-beta-mannosidase